MRYQYKLTVLLGAVLTLMLFLVPNAVRSAAWYDDYAVRKTLTINNPNAEVLTNYQIELTIHLGEGVDSSTDVYLGGNAQSNFNDIRFTAHDGTTLLDYWIETIDGDTATVWVEVNSLQASGNTQIYLYYDNPAAESESDAVATFAFYDNFDVNGIDDWTASEGQVNHAEETGNQDQLVSTANYVSSPNSAQLETYASCFTGPFDGAQSILTASPNLDEGDYRVEFDYKEEVLGFRFSTSGVQRSRVKVNGDEEFYDEISCNGLNCTVEGDWEDGSFDLTDSTIDTIAMYGESYDCANGNTYYDNIRVRHYVSTEPTLVSVGGIDNPDGNTTHHSTVNSHPVSCEGGTIPVGMPDLFQIDTGLTDATLYFTPLSDTDTYFISFSTQTNAEEHGAQVVLGREGVQSFTVNSLSSNTEYYFKVRGQRGCMPGGWSNIRSARTQGGASAVEPQTTLKKATLGASDEAKLKVTPMLKEKTKVPPEKKVDEEPAKTLGIISRIVSFIREHL